MALFEDVMLFKYLSIAIASVISYFAGAVFIKPFPEISVPNVLIYLSIVLILVDVKLVSEVIIEKWLAARIFFLVFECIFFIEFGLVKLWPGLSQLIGSAKGKTLTEKLTIIGLTEEVTITVLTWLTALFIFTCVVASSYTFRKLWKRVKKMYSTYQSRKATAAVAEFPTQQCYCPTMSQLHMQLTEWDGLTICQPKVKRRKLKD